MPTDDLIPTSSPERLPVLFVGHGSPMNAIEDNPFSQSWHDLGQKLPRPRAILCISAHWETRGTWVTAMDWPRTIHDFGGFPPELYQAQYPAPGSSWLAEQTKAAIHTLDVGLDQGWGLDHGCWSILKQLFPKADVPVVQLSLDHFKPGPAHYELAKELAPLRNQGVLILASGNLVHNLGRVVLQSGDFSDFNRPFGLDWAIQANNLFKKLIDEKKHAELANYKALGPAVQLAVPTPEHYVPLLYALALQQEDEAVTYFNDVAVGGSLTMTSLVINHQ